MASTSTRQSREQQQVLLYLQYIVILPVLSRRFSQGSFKGTSLSILIWLDIKTLVLKSSASALALQPGFIQNSSPYICNTFREASSLSFLIGGFINSPLFRAYFLIFSLSNPLQGIDLNYLGNSNHLVFSLQHIKGVFYLNLQ